MLNNYNLQVQSIGFDKPLGSWNCHKNWKLKNLSSNISFTWVWCLGRRHSRHACKCGRRNVILPNVDSISPPSATEARDETGVLATDTLQTLTLTLSLFLSLSPSPSAFSLTHTRNGDKKERMLFVAKIATVWLGQGRSEVLVFEECGKRRLLFFSLWGKKSAPGRTLLLLLLWVSSVLFVLHRRTGK
jgi:hypothetical protein